MAATGKGVTRRGFLKGLIAAGAAPYVIPASVLGADGRPPPSDRLVMGCVGMGGQGTGDMRGYLGFKEVQVVSVCDVVSAKREAAKSIVDRHYGDQG